VGFPLFHVDAFTNRPLAGNPATVCILPDWREDQWLQAVAREMNLSETAFLVKQPGHFDLRWFTPKIEVDLCGHATLASAHVLWQEGLAKKGEEIRFSTRSGILKAALRGLLDPQRHSESRPPRTGHRTRFPLEARRTSTSASGPP
jgi:PhzF family phenazine biosynthesis protein